MSEQDNLEIARRVIDKVEMAEPFGDPKSYLYMAISYCLLDIAKTLREIKAMAERETRDD